MIKFLRGSCLSELGSVLKEPYVSQLYGYALLKLKTVMNSIGRFFHYESLFTSSFSKNLIISETAMAING
jgi:hypothetical protein